MKKNISLILVGVSSIAIFFAFTSTVQAVSVKGYYRNGAYVQPYQRSAPNALKYDNYSYTPSGSSLYNPSYYTPTKSYSPSWYSPSYITQPDYYFGLNLYNSKRNCYSFGCY